MNDKAIPQELKKLRNWVCWKAIPDERSHSGIKKIPINPRTGGQAMSNNPDTWADFDSALSASKDYTGLGFMFGGSGYFGVDIDDMPEELERFRKGEDGIISEFVNTLQSYTEYSQSKTGIHIICRGKLPKGGRKKKHSFGGFEMYDSGRFFVMTGDYCSEYMDISDCTESIKPLHNKYIGAGREPAAAPVIHPRATLDTANDIIRAALNAKNGTQFQALYNGDISAYGSHSEADLAFCNMLAFWCRCDAEKMDAMFRSSGLMREKWDRKQSGTTYGAITIARAIADCTEIYKGASRSDDDYRLTIGDGGQTDEDDSIKLYSFDDMGNAERFVDLFGGSIRYCYTEKKWYYYNTLKWCVDNIGATERMADSAVKAMAAELKVYAQTDADEGTDMQKAFDKHMKASRSNKSKKAMLSEVQHHVPILPSQMDKYRMALNRMEGGGVWYNERQQPFGGMPMQNTDMCSTLCLANLVCSMCCPGSVVCC